MATAKKPAVAEKKPAAKPAVKKAAPAKAAAAEKPARKPNAAFMKPMTPSAVLAAVVGDKPLPRIFVPRPIIIPRPIR